MGMRLQIAFLFPKLSKEEEKTIMEQKLESLDREQQQPRREMEPTLKESTKRVVAYLLSTVLIMTTVPGAVLEAEESQAAPTSSSYAGQGTPLAGQELDSLVAPIALYPDALVAQVLTGATFPDQIAVASYWIQQNKDLTGSALMEAVDKQSWDPSVKALTQFPSVLNNIAQNLSWTSQLGEA